MPGRQTKWPALLRSFLFGALVLPLTSAGLEPTWQRLEEEIKDLTSPERRITDIPSFLEFVKTNFLLSSSGATQLIQLSVQTNLPLARIAGFSGLQQRFPERAFLLGLKLAVSRDADLSEQPLYWMALTNPVNQTTLDAGLVGLMREADAPDAKLSFLFKLLGYDTLWTWYQVREPEWTILQNEAYLLRWLYAGSREHGRELSSKMRERLKSFSHLGGKPRLAYLMCSSPLEQDYGTIMTQALLDETLSEVDLSSLVFARADFISEEIPIEKLQIPPERRFLIRSRIRSAQSFARSFNYSVGR
jgi:hypothetical protein